MKIMNLEEFRALPGETLFSKYVPCNFGELEIKVETWERDFLTQDIASAIECSGSSEFGDKLFEAEECGTSLPMDLECCGRDGCFDEDQLFAVWERDDVVKLIERLGRCVEAE